jgi:hypothetical protein
MKKTILPFFLIHCLFAQAETRHFGVINVQHQLTLSEKEVTNRLIYLNIGTENQAQKQQKWIVYRKNPITNLITQEFYEDALIPIGEIELIHCQPKLCIAKQTQSFGSAPTSAPLIKIGDLIYPIEAK